MDNFEVDLRLGVPWIWGDFDGEVFKEDCARYIVGIERFILKINLLQVEIKLPTW